METRKVYGFTKNNHEIVRYLDTGIWCIETREGEQIRVSVKIAAALCTEGGHILGVPGGMEFDREVRILKSKARLEVWIKLLKYRGPK